MHPSRLQLVDGEEALAHSCYLLSDGVWIDPAWPAESYREEFEVRIRSRKRNVWDRLPSLMPAEWTTELPTEFTCFLASTENLPGLWKTLKAKPGPGPGCVIHLSGLKWGLDEADPKVFVSGNLQEAADFAALAHLEALARPQIVVHAFDGGLLANGIENIDLTPAADLLRLTEGSADFPDLLARFADATGRSMEPSEYVGHPEAESIFVSMGPTACALEEAVRSRKKDGEKIGLLKVRLLSPFDAKAFVEKIPGTVRTVYAWEHPALYLKVLNALHEGMVNRWSWFAALPRLVKFKSSEQAADLAGLTPAADPGRSVGFKWEGLPADGSLGLARGVLAVLAHSCFVQARLIQYGERTDLSLRLSDSPFRAQGGKGSKVLISGSRLPAVGPGPEGETAPLNATLGATALLKEMIASASAEGLSLSPESSLSRWREFLENYYRPLGPNFVRANVLAADAIWKSDHTVEEVPDVARASALPPARGRTLSCLGSARVARVLGGFDDRPGNHEALVLPLIREKALQDDLLGFYLERMKSPSFRTARRPFGDRSFGLDAILGKIRSLMSSLSSIAGHEAPVLGRLSARNPDSWAVLGSDLQEAGIAALEIVFEGPQDRVAVVKRLKEALRIPVLIAFGPFEAGLGEAVRELEEAGADGFVLFQEPPQKDFEVSTGSWTDVLLPAGPRHRLEVLNGLERIRGLTSLPLGAHGGFSTDEDAEKALALGAQWVQRG